MTNANKTICDMLNAINNFNKNTESTNSNIFKEKLDNNVPNDNINIGEILKHVKIMQNNLEKKLNNASKNGFNTTDAQDDRGVIINVFTSETDQTLGVDTDKNSFHQNLIEIITAGIPDSNIFKEAVEQCYIDYCNDQLDKDKPVINNNQEMKINNPFDLPNSNPLSENEYDIRKSQLDKLNKSNQVKTNNSWNSMQKHNDPKKEKKVRVKISNDFLSADKISSSNTASKVYLLKRSEDYAKFTQTLNITDSRIGLAQCNFDNGYSVIFDDSEGVLLIENIDLEKTKYVKSFKTWDMFAAYYLAKFW